MSTIYHGQITEIQDRTLYLKGNRIDWYGKVIEPDCAIKEMMIVRFGEMEANDWKEGDPVQFKMSGHSRTAIVIELVRIKEEEARLALGSKYEEKSS